MRNRIDHPDHYTQGDIECIQAIEAALGKEGALAYCRGSAMKYLWRCLYKKSPKKDLQKAAWYCERAQLYVGDLTTSGESVNSGGTKPLTNKELYAQANRCGKAYWIDTSHRVRAMAEPPEGDE